MIAFLLYNQAMQLTKSDFLLYLEAPMHLWAKAHGKLETKNLSIYDQLTIKQGYEVENLAQEYLKQRLLFSYSAGSTVNFQKTISDGRYEVRLDGLVYDAEEKVYDLYEIKSSTKIEKDHKYDVTFQYLVAKASLPIRKVYLLHINPEFVKDGEVNLQEFFVTEEVNEIVGKLEDKVFELRSEALHTLDLTEAPVDEHCYKIKTCPCLQLCHPDLPAHPIYDLSWWKAGQYEKLLEKGYRELGEIKESEEINPKQILQLRSYKEQRAIIDEAGVMNRLAELVFPLYFLDYETFNPAVPIHDSYKAYQHITFQFSLHVLEKPEDRELKHYEFIATDQSEPSRQLTEALLGVIGDEGSVLVWNKQFECGRNEELARLQPWAAKRLLAINERVFDLMEIFSQGLFVDYRFRGSASIKKVLPVLCPELSYAGLAIAEGATAMSKWWEMVNGQLSDAERAETRENLLRYCELDTKAMVEIWRKLKSIL
jgi:hypothetical protein